MRLQPAEQLVEEIQTSGLIDVDVFHGMVEVRDRRYNLMELESLLLTEAQALRSPGVSPG